ALPELTLIVAATQQMGIGRNGGLPWTGLKREMAYFARKPPAVQNAVIMGRKTWESIPLRFRPLPGRLNVVVSRSAASQHTATPKDGEEEIGGCSGGRMVMVRSLEEALQYLGSLGGEYGLGQKGGRLLGRVFVIGGGEIYRAALRMKEARRVLLTRVRSEFECDTFFPLRLEDGAEEMLDRRWRRSGQEEMDRWVGEEVPRGVQSENGTEYEFEMWERVD
ncbi:hypothetical protein N657DRAFT_548457, partial [Parathielavia appendiculata]